MLKKLSVALCVASLFGASAAMADPGTSTGQILFRGKVVHESPSVYVTRGTSTAGEALNSNPEIQLGQIPASQLDKVAEFNQALGRRFQIVVQRPSGTSYNHIDTATVSLSASVQNGVILNDSEGDEGSADNVGVALQYYGTNGYDDSEIGRNVFQSGSSVALVGPDTDGDFQRDGNGQDVFAYDAIDPTFYFAAALHQVNPDENIGGGDVNCTLTVSVRYE